MTELIAQKGYDVEKWGTEKKLILLKSQTGSGKTYFAQRFLPEICLAHGRKMGIILNRKVLKAQVENKNYEFMLEKCLARSPCQIFTYQQLEGDAEKVRNILAFLAECEFVVLDEAHYFMADPTFNPAAEKSFERLLQLLGKTSLILMTATPDNLKTLLNCSLEIINNSRLKEWEICQQKMNVLRDGFIYGEDGIDALPLYKIIEAEERYKASIEYRTREFEIPRPELFLYEIIGEGQQNYSYVQLNFYDSNDKLFELIIDSAKSEKWLIFVNSKKEGRKLERKLREHFDADAKDKRTVCFISSGFEKNEQMKETVSDIVRKEIYSYSILITTPVLDNGVTISDRKVKNIVVSAFSEYEFKQMLGRRRIKDGETVNLYVYQGKVSYFRKYKRKCFQKFLDAFPIIGKEPLDIESAILKHEVSWDIIDGFTYLHDTRRKFSWLSYYLFSQQYLQLKYLTELMERNQDAYKLMVCEWLGKDSETEVALHNYHSREEIHALIAEEIRDLSDFITRQELHQLADRLTDRSGISVSRSIKAINAFLHNNAQNAFFQSMELAKRKFYYLDRGKEFPYTPIQEIQTMEDLTQFLNDRKKLAVTKFFEQLFGKDMPDIFDEKQQVAFLSFCVKKIKGLEEVSFRKLGNTIQFYREQKKTEKP